MRELLKSLVGGGSLSEKESFSLVSSFMAEGDAPSDSQIAAYLTSTSLRDISIDELTGAVRALREHMVRVDVGDIELLDTCGTGGSGLSTFSTSTLVGFVCAAAGQAVAKHGNRAATSKCGSADFLEALGARIDLSPLGIAQCISEVGFGFMFAPLHHPATKRVVRIRKELGFRTIFNFLGPLSNPAGAAYQMLGVSDEKMHRLMTESLLKLGSKKALVVRGADGLDEITICGSTKAFELADGEISELELRPEDFGLNVAQPEDICGAGPEESLLIAKELLGGQKSAKRDLVVINAAAALYVCGKAANIAEGVDLASDLIDSGKVRKTLDDFCRVSNEQQ